jgi:hypothetical protein
VVLDIGHDHELVGACFRNKRIDARTTVSGEPMMERAGIFIAYAFSEGD